MGRIGLGVRVSASFPKILRRVLSYDSEEGGYGLGVSSGGVDLLQVGLIQCISRTTDVVKLKHTVNYCKSIVNAANNVSTGSNGN